jgi:hypothetical protein
VIGLNYSNFSLILKLFRNIKQKIANAVL